MLTLRYSSAIAATPSLGRHWSSVLDMLSNGVVILAVSVAPRGLLRLGYLYADAALGVIVMLIIAWSEFRILHGSIPILVDARAVEAGRLAEIVATIRGVKRGRAARSRRTSSMVRHR
ncbi:MAG: hypothetical protein ABIT20_23195 [Gemmatimonadaceae bacterium]